MGLSQRYNAAETEQLWQTAWSDAQLYAFDPADLRPRFAIDTPPPTVSGELHIGHVYSYVQAEAMARFWRMQGRNVYYPFGFDDNGLPTERFVEKTHGIRARDLPRGEFIELCLQASHSVEDRFEAFWKRLGFSADWRLRYSTIDPQARQISQWSFLDLHRKGLIYRAQAPNPWCIECQTAIAQAEMDDAERDTVFYTLAFAIDGEGQMTNNESRERNLSSAALCPSPILPIATTRPELLPACVAVFVHPDDPRYAGLPGQQAIMPLFERRVPILADTAVDPQKGSGAVMCCTFGDSTDVQWWQTHQLQLIALLTRTGRLGEDGGPYAGLTLAEARRRIVTDLRAASLLLGEQPSRQSVRIHERCKTPLEILETSQWFVRVLDAKDALIAAGRAIQWHPAHMQARYEHWVANLSWDWCISRQRFYGVPFPAWHCDACGAVVLADHAQLPLDPSSATPPHACSCGNAELRPDTDVMDTWATSSLSPQIAALRWGEISGEGQTTPLSEQLRKWQPMQLRPQAHDIIRTWAFYTIAKAHFHYGALPWETLMISGHALDPNGHSIHKSLGNSPIAPEALITRYGADAVRYWACGGAVGSDQSIDEAAMKQGTRLANKLWSAARLIEQHLANYTPPAAPLREEALAQLHGTDRALLSWQQELIARSTASFMRYEYAAALEATERFFWNMFCDNYLEWVKGRLYDGSGAERRSAQLVLATTFEAILKLLAPIMPHITEEIYQQLFTAKGRAHSIHTSTWPEARPALRDPAAEALGAALLAIAATVRRFKSSQQLGLGATLAGLTLAAEPGLAAQLAACATDLRSVSRAATLNFAPEPGADFTEAAVGLWLRIER